MTQVIALESPIGTLTLVAAEDGEALARIHFAGEAAPEPTPHAGRVLRSAAAQLEAYFSGRRCGFDVALAARGTAFQRAVWDEVVRIAPGATDTYGAIAARLGRPRAARAVGAANGANPIPILVPCHRVIGSAGALTGYAGGLPRKEWLLAHERQLGAR